MSPPEGKNRKQLNLKRLGLHENVQNGAAAKFLRIENRSESTGWAGKRGLERELEVFRSL